MARLNDRMSQVPKMAVLLFDVMINDLQTENETIQFIGDTILYEIIQIIGPN